MVGHDELVGERGAGLQGEVEGRAGGRGHSQVTGWAPGCAGSVGAATGGAFGTETGATSSSRTTAPPGRRTAWLSPPRPGAASRGDLRGPPHRDAG
ncbi:hypothetical protein NKG05_02145 [Oerskovia sp. M15]